MIADRAGRRALPVAAVGLLLCCGCGYIGEPLPPLLNIPMPPADLTAVEQGARIVVRVTLPKLTTEGAVIRRPFHIELRIGPKIEGAFDAGRWSSGAQVVSGEMVENGAASFDAPVGPWVGKQVQLAAKAVGPSGRDAGWSNVVALTVVPPPEQPTRVHAESAPQGVHLTWQGAGNAFAVYRRGPDDEKLAFTGRANGPEYTDTTAVFGTPYVYSVQAVVTAGDGEAQSEPSTQVAITPADTFAPATPTSLTAVPSAASIELVWERNPDANVTGYRVYRALGDGPLQAVGELQTLPAFSDRQVESGKVYRYAVAAVKRNGLESAKTAAVEATAP